MCCYVKAWWVRSRTLNGFARVRLPFFSFVHGIDQRCMHTSVIP